MLLNKKTYLCPPCFDDSTRTNGNWYGPCEGQQCLLRYWLARQARARRDSRYAHEICAFAGPPWQGRADVRWRPRPSNAAASTEWNWFASEPTADGPDNATDVRDGVWQQPDDKEMPSGQTPVPPSMPQRQSPPEQPTRQKQQPPWQRPPTFTVFGDSDHAADRPQHQSPAPGPPKAPPKAPPTAPPMAQPRRRARPLPDPPEWSRTPPKTEALYGWWRTTGRFSPYEHINVFLLEYVRMSHPDKVVPLPGFLEVTPVQMRMANESTNEALQLRQHAKDQARKLGEVP